MNPPRYAALAVFLGTILVIEDKARLAARPKVCYSISQTLDN
ncbi:MAG TPA: hypothetical protein VK178_05325 [Opitutaceae bacterium]|nr:hypothetical protein [Opitutaceae bacterium]